MSAIVIYTIVTYCSVIRYNVPTNIWMKYNIIWFHTKATIVKWSKFMLHGNFIIREIK